MLQHPTGEDFVLATGESYSVRDFLDETFQVLGLDWNAYVKIDPAYYRPAEVDFLHGDSSKARAQLGWKPTTSFKSLVKMMVDHDLALAEREGVLVKAGFGER